MGHGFDDANVGLVGKDDVDVIGTDPRLSECVLDRSGDDPHCPLEDFAAFHDDRVTQIAVEDGFQIAVDTEVLAEEFALRTLFEHDGAGTVTEEDGGTPIGPVDDGRHGVAPDDEHAIGPARRGHHSVGGHIAVREAGTHDVEVHRATRNAQTGGDHGAGGGERLLGRGGAQHEEANVVRREIRSGDGGRGGLGRHVDRGAANPALTDAGPFSDPGVGGLHVLGEVVVGDDLFGKGGADAGDANTHAVVRSQAIGWREVTRSPS